ncbi:MAG: PhzF family phenazine biosynthesis protein [Deltaproteobacteria bacterium]|nr:MAG: PhzF family phenazine biosynthesis protein [Deltaproteobacteria bacterium]
MRRPCYVVDSFAAQALAGNPAGVLLDGADLDSRSMQRIAGELKHSETAFPLPAREPTAALHLRWFTPESEVAFCGHATLAAFHVLVEEARRIRVPDGGVTRTAFTCKSGKLNVELSRREGKLRILIETPASRFEPACPKRSIRSCRRRRAPSWRGTSTSRSGIGRRSLAAVPMPRLWRCSENSSGSRASSSMRCVPWLASMPPCGASSRATESSRIR